MALNNWDIAVLNGIVQETVPPVSPLLDTFFSGVYESETEFIEWDVLSTTRRLTPLVHPLRPGKVVDSPAGASKLFRPAYAKDKRVWQPNAPLKRIPGEKIGGSMSAQQRFDALQAMAIEDQLGMLTMREEVMASELLRTGKVTVSGEGYEPVVVDYGRAAGLTITLSGNDRWSINHTDSDPQGDMEAWSALLQSNGGAYGKVVIMAPDVWTALRTRLADRTQLALLFDYLRTGGATAQLGPLATLPNVRYVGTIGQFDFHVYDQTYVDDNGATQSVMPSGTLIMGDADRADGLRAYGVIQDEEAGYKAQRYFIKSWTEKDPAVRWLLLQAAPLPVLRRPNATLCVKVF